jgi:hypothetical protein
MIRNNEINKTKSQHHNYTVQNEQYDSNEDNNKRSARTNINTNKNVHEATIVIEMTKY